MMLMTIDDDNNDDTYQSVNDAWQLGLNEEITGGLEIMMINEDTDDTFDNYDNDDDENGDNDDN